MAIFFIDEESAELYEQWRTTRDPRCPNPPCEGHPVETRRPGLLGSARSRYFRCTRCGRSGIHQVPNNAPRLPGEDSMDPGPDPRLGRA